MTDEPSTPVSEIGGDRLCVKCGYNLRGQPVVKEPHYALYLARCPECATPAAIQEYPMLGRWPGRIRVLVALIYFVFAILMAGMSGLFLGGMTAILAEEGSEIRAYEIADEIMIFINTERSAGRDPTSGWLHKPTLDASDRFVVALWTGIDTAWYIEHGQPQSLPKRLIRTVTGGLNFLVAMALVFFGVGIAWGVYLLMAKRWAIFLVLYLIAGVVSLFYVVAELGTKAPGQWTTPTFLAAQEYRIPALIVMVSIWLIFAGLGIWLGRPLARLLVRALLPPTMRGSMGELWFTDNKPLPPNTRPLRNLYPEAARDHQANGDTT